MGTKEPTGLNGAMGAVSRSVLRMGVLVEEALRKSLAALENEDFELAAEVIRDDSRIDEMQAIVEQQCVAIIAGTQPDEQDLRRILTAIKVAAELERMGDLARHLARRTQEITDAPFSEVLPLIEEMAERVVSMVHDVLTAFVDDDASAAVAVAARDDEIDILHGKVHTKILQIMRARPNLIDKGIELILVNRFLERLGDHVTNMCESVVFLKRAEHVELNG